MSYDDTSFYGDMIVDEYDDKCNFIGTNTPMGYLAYHLLGDGFDLMSDMCSKFMNDFSILSASASSLDKFWGVSYDMPRPSLPYLYTVVKSDKGILTDYSDIWSTNTTSSIIKVTRTDSYTEFAELTSTNLTNTVIGLSENSIIEFDYYQVDGLNTNSFMNIINSNSATIYTGGINLNQFNAEIGKWYHFKISFKDGTMTMINETTGGTLNKNYTSIPYKFNFWASNTITAIRFKNFKIYDIVYPILFSDGGVTGDSNLSYWYWNTNFGTGSVSNNGTTLTTTNTSIYLTYSATLTSPATSSFYVFNFPMTVEFDIVGYNDPNSTGTMSRVRIYNNDNNNIAYWDIKNYGVGHYKIVCEEGSQKLYFNGVEQSRSFTFTPTTAWAVSFQTYGHIKYKNFVIYNSENPIYSTRLLSDEEYRVYLYLRNCRLITKEDLLINFNKCFGFDDYPIVFSDENFYLEATDHLNYEPTDTVSSNLHKNSEDTTLHFVTDYSNDETTETIESGLTTEEELVTVINIPYNNWDNEFLEMLEQYISIKGNIKIKEYTL